VYYTVISGTHLWVHNADFCNTTLHETSSPSVYENNSGHSVHSLQMSSVLLFKPH